MYLEEYILTKLFVAGNAAIEILTDREGRG